MPFMTTKEKDLEATATTEEETDSSDDVRFIYHFLKCCPNSRCLFSDRQTLVYYLIMGRMPCPENICSGLMIFVSTINIYEHRRGIFFYSKLNWFIQKQLIFCVSLLRHEVSVLESHKIHWLSKNILTTYLLQISIPFIYCSNLNKSI